MQVHVYVSIAIACLLSSCATVPIKRNSPTSEPLTSYVLGTVIETPTGATMVEWIGHSLFLPGFTMTKPVKVAGIGRQPPESGTWAARYTYHGDCPGGRYVITHPMFYEQKIGILVGEDGSIPCDKAVFQLDGVKSGRSWSTPDAIGTRPFRPTFFVEGNVEALIRWELIYSGRSGDEVAVDYREYAGAVARPAFYQQLRYDLSKSNHIVFRQMEIEVLDASNAGVRFRVLRDAERTSAEPSSNLVPKTP